MCVCVSVGLGKIRSQQRKWATGGAGGREALIDVTAAGPGRHLHRRTHPHTHTNGARQDADSTDTHEQIIPGLRYC